MLKARIKIFGQTDKKSEISRFIYVSQGNVNCIRDVKEEIESIFFRTLNIKQHIISITDSDGYIFSEWLPLDKVISDKVNVYICDKACNKCKNGVIEEYTYETEEEIEEKPRTLEIKIDIPEKKQEQKKKLIIPPKRTILPPISGKKKIKSLEAVNIQPNITDKKVYSEKESTIKIDKEKYISISENMPYNTIANKSGSLNNSIKTSSDTNSALLETGDELYTDTTSSTNTSNANYTSADESASESSTGRKYILKKAMKVQPIRKIQAPPSRYGKRK
ncbi:hypothetical protein NEPAR06_1709 [Nematocida parisii]|uniref:Uncharacterized protein n=1 Tax=Nematocida parisii (strain ERTm3) TaxID=935791 RepID=I3EHF3_NEMP3|nr:hypothetical protein NEQG_01340 [Nematocida parisii ERTm3]KAI5130000.1 hypothetical protein NEPAR03_1904 [Nematocida parisii]KAI5130311.1 hypothetical protein NEPAR08_1966 [Nematocida parisii]KAI5143310.1 hypothetical protein NEPAR04_1782 [Nematocida parisii]KAI5143756.1 hypothetical protein NEPAR07_0830 [Nematocida parisii]